MLEWQKDLIADLEFKNKCLEELSTAVVDVYLFKKEIQDETLEALNNSLQCVLDSPSLLLRFIPETHPVFSKYKYDNVYDSIYARRYHNHLIHILTNEKIFYNSRDLEVFNSLVQSKLGAHYVSSK